MSNYSVTYEAYQQGEVIIIENKQSTMKLKIYKNDGNHKYTYGTALAVVAAENEQQANSLLKDYDILSDEYFDIEDWEDTGLRTESDKPQVIAETRYVE